jgi:L-ribulose-5-phosphate 3-epimerase
MNPIGIMQGRLSPPVDGKIQSFPADTWQREFDLAAEVGLDCIEWIYETGTDHANPLRTGNGIREIEDVANATGVAVQSVCADYYMADRLVLPDGGIGERALAHLKALVARVADLGAQHIVLPFVDSSSLGSRSEVDGLLRVLEAALPDAEAASVELHLETDLKPAALVGILDRASHPMLRANYDTGNSASLGYDPKEELTDLASHLGSVHIKDRMLGGTTVPLGQGSADLPACFRLIHAAGYEESFILQAAREAGLSEPALATRNVAFVQECVRRALGE